MEDKIKSIITCDLDGKVETFSEGAEKLFGYTIDEVVGKKRVSDFSPGEVVLGHVVNWLKIAVDKGEWEGETVFIGKDKNEIPSKIKITPTKGKSGEHIGYCGVTTPLSDKTADEVRPKISFFTKVFKWMVIMRLPFLSATWFDDIPRLLYQPDGESLECFITGDQYSRRLHDINDFTIGIRIRSNTHFISYIQKKMG